jgi:hypothetical protein
MSDTSTVYAASEDEPRLVRINQVPHQEAHRTKIPETTRSIEFLLRSLAAEDHLRL